MAQGRRLIGFVVILMLAVPILSATGAVDWQTGRLLTIELSGTGLIPRRTLGLSKMIYGGRMAFAPATVPIMSCRE